ncbi:hypothetical protein D3C81_2091100 [compost metagenome]
MEVKPVSRVMASGSSASRPCCSFSAATPLVIPGRPLEKGNTPCPVAAMAVIRSRTRGMTKDCSVFASRSVMSG